MVVTVNPTVLRVRVQLAEPAPKLTVVCPGFEQSIWRAADLVQDLFFRHLASFALSYTEFNSINGDTAGRSMSRAAKIVYDTDKYRKRGEFGELILHAITRDFFGAQPAVSKIYYKDSDNDTVKGFDSVHIVESNGKIELWLGEVKYYSQLSAAIRDVAIELKDHFDANFLKREFVAITNKLDPNWQHSETVATLLDSANSLDEIIDSIVVPILLTYESPTVKNSDAVGDEYIKKLREEAEQARINLLNKLDIPFDITVQLILLPLENKLRLTGMFHEKLKVWQHL